MVRIGTWISAALLWLSPASAFAGCSIGSLPFQLQDNTLADATQVMANFNQVISGAGVNCAGAGNNTDITSLGSLSTPLSPAQGGSPVFAGSTTTGSANAQSITVNSNFTATNGYHVTGFWGFTNTAQMTINVNGNGIFVFRKTQLGIEATQGGEAVLGEPFDLVYNSSVPVLGAGFIMTGERILVGEMRYISGSAVPPGWFVADGSTFVCATFQQLCAVLGTTYGGTGANPALPDTRGRVLTGLDNYGTSIGAASRLTNASTGCGTAFTGRGVTCANSSESHTQQTAEVGVHAHTDAGHTHNVRYDSGAGAGTGTGPIMEVSSGGTNTNPGAGANSRLDGTVAVLSGTASIQNNQGSATPMPIVNPNLGVIGIIRF